MSLIENLEALISTACLSGEIIGRFGETPFRGSASDADALQNRLIIGDRWRLSFAQLKPAAHRFQVRGKGFNLLLLPGDGCF